MAKKNSKKKGGRDEDPTDELEAPEAGPQEEMLEVEGLVEEPAGQLPAFDADDPYEYLEALGIQRADVLGLKPSDDRQSVKVITKGGAKLVFPGDEEKALKLTESQRDGEVHQASHVAHLFKK